MSSPELKAISLDVDGTLYSLRRMVLRHPLLMAGLADFFRDLHTVRRQLRGRKLDDFYGEQARLFAQIRAVTAEQALATIKRAVEERWAQAFRRLAPWRGLRRSLECLLGRGLRLALVSDYPMDAKLAGLGLSDLPFACRVVTERVGALKPHPAGFLLAAQQLGLEPQHILHVGDREDHDVAGALAAGLRAVLFCPHRRPPRTRAAFVLRRWRDLEPQLLRLGWLPGAEACVGSTGGECRHA